MKLRMWPLFVLAVAGIAALSMTLAHAYNPITDIEQNTTFPIGQAASAGTAINLRNGETSTSMLGEVKEVL